MKSFQPPMVIPDDSRGNAPSLVQPPANHERANGAIQHCVALPGGLIGN